MTGTADVSCGRATMGRVNRRRLPCVLLLVGTLSGCGGTGAAVTGGCAPGSAVEIAHEGSNGAETPVAAAKAFGAGFTGGPLRTADDGWVVTEQTDSEAVLRDDDVEATAVRLPDGTWAVDGARCAG